jgi:hypothetical protein
MFQGGVELYQKCIVNLHFSSQLQIVFRRYMQTEGYTTNHWVNCSLTKRHRNQMWVQAETSRPKFGLGFSFLT